MFIGVAELKPAAPDSTAPRLKPRFVLCVLADGIDFSMALRVRTKIGLSSSSGSMGRAL